MQKTENLQRLDRCLGQLLGNLPLFRIYTYEDVLERLITARKNNVSSIELDGLMEDSAATRFLNARFKVTPVQTNDVYGVKTIVSW
jgi:hypothetical protein